MEIPKSEIEHLSKAEFKQLLKEAAVKLYEAKEAEFPEPEHIRELERIVLLRVIDRKWMDHLDDMGTVETGVLVLWLMVREILLLNTRFRALKCLMT